MRDAEYIARLHKHLTDYRAHTLASPAGEWGTPPRQYGHILPRRSGELNIVEPLRAAFWRAQKTQSWRLHRYFHHLSSSQALAFNIFFPLYPKVPSAFAVTRHLLGLHGDASAEIDFEVELRDGDGTNIDVMITEAGGRRTVIEVKLTEASFGRARHDARHVQKLDEVYRPLLRGRLPACALQPEPFFRNYQLFRNLAQLRPGSDDSVLLLLPRGRPQLWQFADAWCAQEDLGSLRGRIRVVALEDLVTATQTDALSTGSDPRPFQAVAAKYFVPAG